MPEEAIFHFENGLEDYLKATINGATLVHPDIFAGKSEKKGGHGTVEWAVGFVADVDPFLSSYCNTIPTPDGGTHESGLRSALTKGIKDHAERTNQGKRAAGDHQRRRDGGRRLHALGVHPRAGIPGPDQGPPRDQRSHPHRRERDQGPVRPLARRPIQTQANKLLDFVIERADERIRRRQEKEISRKSAVRKLRLPGKLADCTQTAADGAEIFIVEGD